MREELKTHDLEIVIATMNRDSLDFLVPMFPFGHFSDFSILIINQTNETKILASDYPSVRVINSFEKGLSKSRNLGLKSAKGQIILIADDDVIYVEDFVEIIIKSFKENKEAVAVTFNHQRIGLNFPYNSFIYGYLHNRKTIKKVCSIEIVFKLEEVKKSKIYFDIHFGLGAYFETAEEFLFLKNMLNANLKLYYNPKVILYHPLVSSGEFQGDDKIVYARAALNFKLFGYWSYLWLFKYVFFVFRNKYINSYEWSRKVKVGLSGIKKYKELEKIKDK